MKNLKFIFALMLVVSLYILPILGALGWNEDAIKSVEKRTPQSFPRLKRITTNAIKEYFSGVDAFIKDRIAFRQRFLDCVSKVYLAFNIAPDSGKVLIGRDGWLFLGEDMSEGMIDKLIGKTTMSKQVLAKNLEKFSAVANIAANHDIPLVLLPSPNKSSIYPEFLPSYLIPAEIPYITPLLKGLAEQNIPVHYPRQALLDAKSSRILYYRTDTHWNPAGAYEAFASLLPKLRQLGLAVDNVFADMEFLPEAPLRGDLLGIGNLYMLEPKPGDSFSIGNLPEMRLVKHGADGTVELMSVGETTGEPQPGNFFSVKNLSMPDGPCLWLFRDSFSSWLSPYLHCTFGETVHFPTSDGLTNLQCLLETSKQRRPDVIVLQFVERIL